MSAEGERLARSRAIRNRDADRLEASLDPAPEPIATPTLVVLAGLPGSGKSYLAREVAGRHTTVILDSDALRRVLCAEPQHTEREHARLFPAMHVLIDRLLERGISVIVDATNLKESSRRPYYQIAKKRGALLVLVRTWAPKSVVRERLRRRALSPDPLDRSTADIAVYETMRLDAERIRRPHITVDTSRDIGPAVDRIMRLLQS